MDRVDILHPRHDAAEHRVAAVEREARLEHDEELAVRAVFALRTPHRQRPAHVRGRVEFGLEVGNLRPALPRRGRLARPPPATVDYALELHPFSTDPHP